MKLGFNVGTVQPEIEHHGDRPGRHQGEKERIAVRDISGKRKIIFTGPTCSFLKENHDFQLQDSGKENRD